MDTTPYSFLKPSFPRPCAHNYRWPQRPLIATAFMFQPLHLALASPGTPEDMSSLRPPRSVFHLSTFLSLLGQAGVHVACMAFAVKAAQAHSVEVRMVCAMCGCGGRKLRGGNVLLRSMWRERSVKTFGCCTVGVLMDAFLLVCKCVRSTPWFYQWACTAIDWSIMLPIGTKWL